MLVYSKMAKVISFFVGNCYPLLFSQLHNARVTAANWGEMWVQQRRTTEAYIKVRLRERGGSWSRRLPQGVAVTFVVLILGADVAAATASCSEEQYLVRAHKRSGYTRSDGVYVSPALVSAHCKNYRTYRSAEIHFHTVKSTSSSKNKYKNFSKKDKRQIREAFKKIPQILTGIGKVTLYRQSRDGQYPMNPASINSKTKKIILYDSIHQYSMERVLAHELAHIY